MIINLSYVSFERSVAIDDFYMEYANFEVDDLEWIQGRDAGVRIKTRDSITFVPWTNIRYAIEDDE